MKRFAFPLTIILLMITVVALAAPGDKRPAVTSAAIGLGTNSSATMASVTATTSVTAPAYNSTAADGYHYILPYNSTAFAGTPLTGMIMTTPTGPQWYTGSAWEAIGSGGGGTWGSITGTLSAQADLQAALDAITAGGITISTGTPSTPGTAYLNDTTHVLTVASSTGYTQFTGSFTAWDTTPAAFSFTDLTDVALSTEQTATPVQITGINYPTAVTASGGTAAICTGATVGTCGAFSASPGNIANNQYVSARHTSSGSNSTAVDTTVSIGGVSDVFSSTTVAGSASLCDGHNYLFCTGWEQGSDELNTGATTESVFSAYTGTLGGMAVVSDTIEGSKSLHITGSTNEKIISTFADSNSMYFRVALKFTTAPSTDSTVGIMSIINDWDTTVDGLALKRSGSNLYLSGTSDCQISLNEKYEAVIYFSNSSGDNIKWLKVYNSSGANICDSGSVATNTSRTLKKVSFGNSGYVIDANIDAFTYNSTPITMMY